MRDMKVFKIAALALPLLAFAGCGDDIAKSDYNIVPSGTELATVETQELRYNFGIGAVVDIKATPSSDPVQEEFGVVSSNQRDAIDGDNPDIANPLVTVSKATSIEADGSATIAIDNLTDGETYYYRAFAYNERGITFGEVREFTADASLSERRQDFAVRFNDMTGADIDLFTVFQFDEESYAFPFTPKSLSLLGLRGRWGFVSTLFDVDLLFDQGQGDMISPVDNVLVYEADFSGKFFPQLNISAYNLTTLFGYADFSGNFEVRASATPITNQEEYEAATKLGDGIFPKDKTDPEISQKAFTFDIPGKFNGGTCYIAVKNSCYYDEDENGNEVGNFGLIITDYSLSSLYPKE